MTSDMLRAIDAASRREHLLLRARAAHRETETARAGVPEKLEAIATATRVFTEHGVAYALIGGIAVGIRSGIPRATLDVDFAIPTTVDVTWLTERLVAHGFIFKGRFAHSINFEHESGEPVQLAFDPAFDDMIERAEPTIFGDLVLRVVTREDLITMKRRAAADPSRRRSKALRDEADVALLEGDVPGDNEGW